ncbi:glutamate synthase large subunit [Ilyobacter polytropus]|uniref:Glutamate synthase (NADH) large subunit n=1 Tax=Ilyobacter polytropus (strain ATCC 51220 / DSM 2926 / LMG 16218 / CuHBu1) TaxID=572544 RepID=E3HCW3_ILYPC|nr:glutamate synthase large subunit [Ilyobacter polytropus]ADO84019.1 glutamate synthase (NADH) large subunit [Ilyobacter polytropus DSM 2926]
MKRGIGVPKQQGLYVPEFEKDNCGIGLIAQIKGQKTHDIVKKGIEILEKMEHRGAVGADPDTGDGAGILIQIPDKLFRSEIKELPEFGDYGVGMIFFPQENSEREKCKKLIEKIIKDEGQEFLAWRDVPVDPTKVGKTASKTTPCIKQLFIKKSSDTENFELKLYIIRKAIENEIPKLDLENEEFFYIPSMSSRTIVYKGLLKPDQISGFYKDLSDDRTLSALAIVHQRYSTNTFPSWDLAHPFRYVAHNGEINTIKGNVNWMTARQPELYNDVLGKNISKIFPINKPVGSDSSNLDRALEFLVASGKSLLQAASILVPPAWEKDPSIKKELKDFYEYYSGLMEPWDGPAALVMSNGRQIVTKLDRNGLRPARYTITKDDTIILASEAGTLETKPEDIKENFRIKPGMVLMIDLEKGKIYSQEEIIEKIVEDKPFGQWLSENKKCITNLPETDSRYKIDFDTLFNRLMTFGYSREDLHEVITPMAKDEKEPTGSMGNDAALAVLSGNDKKLFNYFQQLFAQVTNPPIDPIREDVVMSITTNIGRKGNILEETADKAKLIKMDSPFISNEDLDKIASLNEDNFKSAVIPMMFNLESGLEKGMEKLFEKAESAIKDGHNILILSDREMGENEYPIPSLLATAGLHHHLIRTEKRNGVDIIVETGDAREVMDFALLIGYGALAVNPYLALESIDYMVENELYMTSKNAEKKKLKYLKAIGKGLVKIMSKMGISTVQSYRGAQIFEAVGLKKELVDKYFTGTTSRIEGIGIEGVERSVRQTVDKARDNYKPSPQVLPNTGDYKWRKGGERRLFSPEAVAALQHSTRTNDYEEYKKFAKLINEQGEKLATIRGLFKFKGSNSIPLEEVEPVESIMKRFVTGAMSFGSISREAHEAMAIAMNTIGGKSNSGEGGEDPKRFADNRKSAIKQVASGRFGVTTNYLVNADELQIKMAQGAKPGEGGHLPGHKVTEEIAATRYTSPGIDLISPPPHHDIYSIEDLAQLIFDLKNVNPTSRISVKLVSEVGVGTVAAGVAKAHSDMILISGYDGGTGASPISSIKHAGLPWELGLSEAHQVLILNDLRGRVRIQADGQMKTGRDIVIAALLGAEEFGFATAPLVVLGCIMMRACHTNMCPVGVATQSPELRKKFMGRSEYLINFFRFIAQDVREIMAELGFKNIDEMIGRTDLIEMNEAISHWKASGIDISKILYKPEVGENISTKCVQAQDHGIDDVLDRKLIDLAKPALEKGEKVEFNMDIFNLNRSTGTMLSGDIAKRYGAEGLPEDTIKFNFKGYSGQSFGAFGMSGLTLNLVGQSNDYIGKGLFGGKIIVKTPEIEGFEAENNIIGGNTILYGAIKGQVYINGMVGERFCVRNSGAEAVVEGVGDHGCEYMTGGRVAVLGPTGKNFAAGMSGGIAYVYDQQGDFKEKVNQLMVLAEKIEDNAEEEKLKLMIEKHVEYTNSSRGKEILDSWEENLGKFVRVIAPKYKELLAQGKVK